MFARVLIALAIAATLTVAAPVVASIGSSDVVATTTGASSLRWQDDPAYAHRLVELEQARLALTAMAVIFAGVLVAGFAKLGVERLAEQRAVAPRRAAPVAEVVSVADAWAAFSRSLGPQTPDDPAADLFDLQVA